MSVASSSFVIINKYDKFYIKENKEDLKEEFLDFKIRYYLNVLYNHNITIKEFILKDFCYKYDNTKDEILKYNEFHKIYKIKDRKNKKHIFTFVEMIDDLTIYKLETLMNKVYKIWENSTKTNIDNKHFMKFIRRICFDEQKLNKIHLIIHTKNPIPYYVIDYLENKKLLKSAFNSLFDIKLSNFELI